MTTGNFVADYKVQYKTCPECGGTGQDKSGEDCQECKGDGYIEIWY